MELLRRKSKGEEKVDRMNVNANNNNKRALPGRECYRKRITQNITNIHRKSAEIQTTTATLTTTKTIFSCRWIIGISKLNSNSTTTTKNTEKRKRKQDLSEKSK